MKVPPGHILTNLIINRQLDANADRKWGTVNGSRLPKRTVLQRQRILSAWIPGLLTFKIQTTGACHLKRISIHFNCSFIQVIQLTSGHNNILLVHVQHHFSNKKCDTQSPSSLVCVVFYIKGTLFMNPLFIEVQLHHTSCLQYFLWVDIF